MNREWIDPLPHPRYLPEDIPPGKVCELCGVPAQRHSHFADGDPLTRYLCWECWDLWSDWWDTQTTAKFELQPIPIAWHVSAKIATHHHILTNWSEVFNSFLEYYRLHVDEQ